MKEYRRVYSTTASTESLNNALGSEGYRIWDIESDSSIITYERSPGIMKLVVGEFTQKEDFNGKKVLVTVDMRRAEGINFASILEKLVM